MELEREWRDWIAGIDNAPSIGWSVFFVYLDLTGIAVLQNTSIMKLARWLTLIALMAM